MQTIGFNDRAKALENAFFHDVDKQLIDELRSEATDREAKREVRSASGVWNDAVLAELVDLDVRSETIMAVSLIPLVAVAWADGSVSPEERERILAAEQAAGIDVASPTHRLLEHWLDNFPGPDMLEAWKNFVQELRGRLSPARGTLLDSELLERAEGVAKASGGYWTYGSISPSEKRVLQLIRNVLKND